MTTYRRSHRRFIRSDPRRDPHPDPDGWVSVVLAVLFPFIVGLVAWLYALALQS